MMNKQSIFYAIATILLAVYLGVAGVWASRQAHAQKCGGLEGGSVQVVTDSDRPDPGFVTPEEMTRRLGSLAQTMHGRRIDDINLDSLERVLKSFDKLETAMVNRLANSCIRIQVWPLEPVARVWSKDGSRSRYINREGKQMEADARFTIDVPQVSGEFSGDFGPERLIPLFDWLSIHPEWSRLITMVTVPDSSNVILVPAVRGHVVNFGEIRDIAGKFDRLKTFYSDVMPVKGWEYYDTVSVKWDGQIVATRRKNKLPESKLEIIDELENEGDTQDTMDTGAEA
ncbi:MAG: hypothetical protein K2F82_05290 [Muribaculaceae bacterium]|nr:hypothetical protein [Muribaculaceae bacterium]